MTTGQDEKSLRAKVTEYRRLETRIEARVRELADMRRHLNDLRSDIGNEVGAGQRKLVRVGKNLVMVDHPLQATRPIEIEKMELVA